MHPAGKDVKNEVKILPSDNVFPVDWRYLRGDRDMPTYGDMNWTPCNYHNGSFDPDACKKFFPKSYSITWWTHYWSPDRRRRLHK